MEYLKNVATLELNRETCIGCGRCEEVCPHGVFRVSNRKAEILDLDHCMECGACAINCPVDAIAVESGVGCASAIIIGAIRGTEPTCDCTDGSSCCA